MSLKKESKNQYRVTVWDENVTAEDVSDAIFREFYGLHSVHIKIDGTASVTLQLSNFEEPSEASDDDWVEVDTYTASAMVPVNQVFRWLRLKRDNSTDPVTIVILSASRANT